MIDNRGVKVWPDGMSETFCTDSFRCRFTADERRDASKQILALLGRIAGQGSTSSRPESLHSFDGQARLSRSRKDSRLR